MTRDEAKAALEAGKTLKYGVWSWTGTTRGCWSEDNCCYEYFESMDEVLDDVEAYATLTGFEEVEVID